MDQIRAIGEWIIRRKYLSLIASALIIAAAAAARTITQANAGQLSGPIERKSITDAVYGIGTVTAYKRLSFNPQISNTLNKSYVMEGDRVHKGQPLMKTESGVIHYAPFDGIVNYFPYRMGENAYPTSPMMVFTDTSDRYIVVNMEQQGAMRVKAGQTAKVSFDSLRDKVFEGKVSAVYSYNSNFYARIDTVALPEFILPDMTCDVAIVIGVHENAIVIPSAAFVKGNVWVKRGRGIPHAIPVKLGVIDGTHAEVLEGAIEPGDRVLIRSKVD
jgi:multidrug efflux pump subunit AcrA (membrane-fusion protein)